MNHFYHKKTAPYITFLQQNYTHNDVIIIEGDRGWILNLACPLRMTASVPAIKRNSRKGVFFDITPLISPSLCFFLSVCLAAWHCIGFNVIITVWRLRASLCGRGSLLWTCGCACKHLFVWTFLTVVMNLDLLEWCCTNIRKGANPIINAFGSCFFFLTEFLCSYLHHVARNTILTVRVNETWKKTHPAVNRRGNICL